MSAGLTIDAYWNEMVTAALLGTDRREPPAPPAGALADLAADDPQPTASQRLLQQVAGCTVARRAGMLPSAGVPPIAPPDEDARPVTRASCTATWHRIVDHWPVLEDEWMLHVIQGGWRLAAELVVPVLNRYRTDATRHARARVAAGPLAEWLVQWMPRLGCTAKQAASMEAIGELPALAILPEFVPLLSAAPRQAASALAAGLSAGAFGVSHRGVLVNFVARVQPASLPALADALSAVDPSQPSIGLAFALADLARLRHQMLTELEPA
jgi:hypothetical protein